MQQGFHPAAQRDAPAAPRSAAPSAAQKRQPVFMRQFDQQPVVIAMQTQGAKQALQACHIPNIGGQGRAVEIRTKPNAILA